MSLASVLPLLICPFCAAGSLELVGGDQRGEVRCPTCGRTTPVRDGVWDAMGDRRPQRSAAQITNVVPTPWFYDRFWRPGASKRFSGGAVSLDDEMAELRAAMEPVAGRLVVDVGASEARYARELAAAGATVIAVDHSMPFLTRVAERARSSAATVVPIRAIAQHLPIATGVLGGAVMGGSLNEIGDATQAAGEMARVVGSGGRLFSMSLIRARTLPGRLMQAAVRPSGIVFPSAPDTAQLWEGAGFTGIEMRTDGVLLRVSGTRR